MASEPIAAPVASGVARTIGAADAGQTITVKTGERIAFAFVGVPTAGYLWAAQDPPAFLTADGEGGGPTHGAQRQPGFSGGNHWEVFYFKVAGPGSGPVRFVQRRPWETEEPPVETFEVQLKAK